MIIKTKSRRLIIVAKLARLLPPALSGWFTTLVYSPALARRENVGFIAKSSLADIVFSYQRAEYHATFFAVRGYNIWQNVVIANTVCKRGDTIIDVGSNIGTETLLFARKVGPEGKVVSFEPLPNNFSTLEQLIKLNKLENVILHKAAVSDRIGKLRFLPPPDDWNSGNGRLLENEAVSGNFIEVDTYMLDQLFAAGEFSCPRLIVMDCEGAELFVLRGAKDMIKQCLPFIILEIMPPFLKPYGLEPSDLFDFLQERGYTSWVISGFGLKPALRGTKKSQNWLCIPSKHDQQASKTAKMISRRIKIAAFLPLIKWINPAVVT